MYCCPWAENCGVARSIIMYFDDQHVLKLPWIRFLPTYQSSFSSLHSVEFNWKSTYYSSMKLLPQANLANVMVNIGILSILAPVFNVCHLSPCPCAYEIIYYDMVEGGFFCMPTVWSYLLLYNSLCYQLYYQFINNNNIQSTLEFIIYSVYDKCLRLKLTCWNAYAESTMSNTTCRSRLYT